MQNNILKYSDIFNQDTLNIFTDASVMHVENETIGCPGVVIVATDINGIPYVLNTYSYINNHSTNNDSEIKAIYSGVLCGLGYRNNFKRINLFSDSNICIQGLKDWIFNWIYCIQDNTMYSSSGQPVANQMTFMAIVHTIVNSNFEINLFHQKGHVNINSQKSLDKAKNSMVKSNRVKDIDMDLVIQLSIYNDMVDKMTKKHLEDYYDTEYVYSNRKKNLFKIEDTNQMILKIRKYKELIGV